MSGFRKGFMKHWLSPSVGGLPSVRAGICTVCLWVLLTKSNPAPSNSIKPNQTTKIVSVTHEHGGKWSRDKLYLNANPGILVAIDDFPAQLRLPKSSSSICSSWAAACVHDHDHGTQTFPLSFSQCFDSLFTTLLTTNSMSTLASAAASSKRNSHHWQRSSVSTSHESAEIVDLDKVEIPETLPTSTSALTGSLMASGKWDTFKPSSSKDQLHTLVEEEEHPHPRRSSISYKSSSTSSTSAAGLPAPEMTLTFAEHHNSLSLGSNASDEGFSPQQASNANANANPSSVAQRAIDEDTGSRKGITCTAVFHALWIWVSPHLDGVFCSRLRSVFSFGAQQGNAPPRSRSKSRTRRAEVQRRWIESPCWGSRGADFAFGEEDRGGEEVARSKVGLLEAEKESLERELAQIKDELRERDGDGKGEEQLDEYFLDGPQIPQEDIDIDVKIEEDYLSPEEDEEPGVGLGRPRLLARSMKLRLSVLVPCSCGERFYSCPISPICPSGSGSNTPSTLTPGSRSPSASPAPMDTFKLPRIAPAPAAAPTHRAIGSLSKTWTFPAATSRQTQTPPSQSRDRVEVDKFFNCLEDSESDFSTAGSRSPASPCTYDSEHKKGHSLFAKALEAFDEDDVMPFALPPGILGAIGQEEQESPRSLDIVFEEEEGEEETQVDDNEQDEEDDNYIFGAGAGIMITVTPAAEHKDDDEYPSPQVEDSDVEEDEEDEEEQEDDEEQSEQVVQVSNSSAHFSFARKPVPLFNDEFDEDENDIPFNFGHPLPLRSSTPPNDLPMATPPRSTPSRSVRAPSPSTSSIPRPKSFINNFSSSSSTLVDSDSSFSPVSTSRSIMSPSPPSKLPIRSSSFATPPTKPSFIPQPVSSSPSPNPIRKAPTLSPSLSSIMTSPKQSFLSG
ncbi:hypothetical protein BT96DRAFT_997471 [Gymnopus androsaceus JB14]|uniref:Uncharacterized protein n=1 Tax=Gymnopus androsaceus JB14 TaxID=1447944 RepID=A0A6A4HEY7_9AGAR|nr:hypothetical protein BT96DRAFT_997471 [Gymnopus androsaceus JB14]